MTKSQKNNLCWCGSGLELEHCHLNRAIEAPATREEVINTTKTISELAYCSHPQANPEICNGIIKAHTVQRSGSLKQIARKGHVYGFMPGPTFITRQNPYPYARLIGIKEASTFTGFCALHDNKTFVALEDQPFAGTQQQSFLLAYRSICNELYRKRIQHKLYHYTKTMDRGKSLEEQRELQEYINSFRSNIEVGLAELDYYKQKYDTALINSDYLETMYYIVLFDRAPDLMCSGTCQPEYDFGGARLQDLNKKIFADHITLSLIAANEGGAAVFSWIGDSPAAIKLIKSLSLLTVDQLPHALVRFAFEYFENIYASPTWWDGLGDAERSRLLYRARSGTGLLSRRPNHLKDDNMRAVSWKVVDQFTNVIT